MVVRRIGRSRRDTYQGLDMNIEQALETGKPWWGEIEIEILQEAWAEHGACILAKWINEKPGTRPFAWWLLEAVPKWGERRTTRYWTSRHEAYRASWLLYGILNATTVPAVQEPEVDYLRRHKLMATDEERRLAEIED